MTTYATGTIAVSNSSTAVTGTSTAWTTSGTKAGDLLIAAGLVVPIASVNSATSITLARPWPGSALSGANYNILQIDDGLRALIAYNTLLQSISGGNLYALSDLTGAADKFPYFTSVSAMALATVTTFGRSILAGADAAAVRTTLGIGGSNNLPALAGLTGAANKLPYFTAAGAMTLTDLSAAGRALIDDADAAAQRSTLGLVLTTSVTDTTIGRVVKVGDFGLGTTITLTASDNLNNLTATGFYYNPTAGNVSGNNYPISAAGTLIHVQRSSTNRSQEYISFPGTSLASEVRKYVRSYGGSGWSPWVEVLHLGRVLGTVSQASGVPTGAIIERGSNANGEYVRYADGTQICWGTFNLGSVVANGSGTYASPYHSNAGTASFAASFSVSPTVAIEFQSGSGLGVQDRAIVPAYYSVSPTGINTLRGMRLGGGSSASDATGTFVAVGRWF